MTSATTTSRYPPKPQSEEVRERLKTLERENRELTRATEIVRTARASFAAAALR
jgi:transposase-like protein